MTNRNNNNESDIEWVDEWGITRHRCGEIEGFEDPGWEYVYTEDGDCVSCPDCGEEELRYHDGECRCIKCYGTFSIHELEKYEGPCHHS